MNRLRTYSLALVVSMLISLPVLSQTPAAYANTPVGLQQCLTEILTVAKRGDHDNLAARIKDMEIPDFAKWFDKTYGKSKGKDSAELYRMNVDSAEYKFANYLTKLVQQDGQPLARKVTGSPQSTDELAMLGALKKPVDIYCASYTYKEADSAQPQPDAPIGYFMFIDGKFRWSNALSSKVLPKPGDSHSY